MRRHPSLTCRARPISTLRPTLTFGWALHRTLALPTALLKGTHSSSCTVGNRTLRLPLMRVKLLHSAVTLLRQVLSCSMLLNQDPLGTHAPECLPPKYPAPLCPSWIPRGWIPTGVPRSVHEYSLWPRAGGKGTAALPLGRLQQASALGRHLPCACPARTRPPEGQAFPLEDRHLPYLGKPSGQNCHSDRSVPN